MFLPKAIYCRVFQAVFKLALPILPYRDPEIINSCENVNVILEKENVQKVLIVTDQGIMRNKLTANLEKTLKENSIDYVIYDKTEPNPTIENVEEAVVLYHKHHCQAIIAMGGGSSMDCGKAVGARIAYPNKSIAQMKGVLRILRRLPTFIAIPTTAGTGSETTLAAVISDRKTHQKYALMSFPLIPHYAILDAKLTYSLPQHLTSTTGMDALTHAIEAYIGKSTTKKTRRLAKEAVKLIFENIEDAYHDGYNDTARNHMLLAAYKAGVAFSMSYVGYIHALAHSLGGAYNTPHGLANAVIMPYVLEAYGSSVYDQLYELAVVTKVCDENTSKKEGAMLFISAIKKLNENMNIPRKLDCVKKEDIPSLAKHAQKEANPLYPVPKLMTESELANLYLLFSTFE